MVNAKAIRNVVARIEADPSKWDQRWWVTPMNNYDLYDDYDEYAPLDLQECGTTACLAGHAVYAAGMSIDTTGIVHGSGRDEPYKPFTDVVAMELLGLTWQQASKLFYNSKVRTICELKKLVTQVTGVTFDKEADHG